MEHTIDAIRAEDAFSSKLGYEEHIPGQTRDWNEELQTTRELSRYVLPIHGLVILTRFHYNWAKIVDLLLLAHFLPRVNFFATVSRCQGLPEK